MRAFAKLSENFLKDIVVWVLPIVAIPSLRYIQDGQNEQRRTLFFRDLFSYGLGATSFFSLKHLSMRLLKNSSIARKDLVGTLFGSLGYFAFATTGVLKLTDWVKEKFPSVPAAATPSRPIQTPARPLMLVNPVAARNALNMRVTPYPNRPLPVAAPSPFQMARV